MYFERLRWNPHTYTIYEDMLIGDEFFQNATVQWSGFSKGDRQWLLDQLGSMLSVWGVAVLAPAELSLTARTSLSEGTLYHLNLHEGSAELIKSTHDLADLSAGARAEILKILEEALDALHALLIL